MSEQQVDQTNNNHNNNSIATPSFWNHYMRDFFDDPFFRNPFSFNWPHSMMQPFHSNRQQHAMSRVRSDISETDKEIKVLCEVPGLKKEDLKIEVDDDTRMLTISGEHKTEQKEEQEQYHVMERSYGQFVRRFKLPEHATMQDIKAKLEDGVLRLSIPKVQQPQKKVKQIQLE